MLTSRTDCYLGVSAQSRGAPTARHCDALQEPCDEKVADANLWIPGLNGGNYSHGQWITKLACTLIESGCVKDEVLAFLSPICGTKVSLFSSCVCQIVSCYCQYNSPKFGIIKRDSILVMQNPQVK